MTEIFPELMPLARGLDATALRHKILAGNLANADTPGYVRYDVKFEELLRERLGTANVAPGPFRNAIAAINPIIAQDRTGEFSPNGNNVTLEKEASQISRNEILYNMYAEILSLKIGQIRHAISSR